MPALEPIKPLPITPLILSDRLLALAQEAERAGYSTSATRLVGLAHTVFDERPRRN